MDLGEYRMTERERLLKRAGVFCLWRGISRDRAEPAAPRDSEIDNSQKIPNNYTIPPYLLALFHEKQYPVRTLWTYPGLAADLGLPTPSPRLALFRKIQESVCGHLGWKKQDISAWPLDVEDALLRHGLEHFCPSVVICFVQDASEIRPLQTSLKDICPQTRLFLLPDITDMAKGNQAAKNTAWKILQDIFPASP